MPIKSVSKLRDITWGVLDVCTDLHSHHARAFATKENIVAKYCFIVRRICYSAAFVQTSTLTLHTAIVIRNLWTCMGGVKCRVCMVRSPMPA